MKLVALHEADMNRRDFLKMLGKMAGASQLGPITDVGNVIASLSKATSPVMFTSYSLNLFERAGGSLMSDLAQAKDVFGVLSRLGGGVRSGIEGRDMASFVNKDNLASLFKWAGSRGYKVKDHFSSLLDLDTKVKREIAEKGFWVDDRGEKRYHGVPEVIMKNASKGWWSIEDEHGNKILNIDGAWNEPAEGGYPLEDPMQLVWEEIQRQLKWKIEDGKLDPNYVKPQDLEQLKKEGLKVDPGVEQAIKAPAPETRADRKQWGPSSRKVQFQFPDAEEPFVRNKFEGLTVAQRALCEADEDRRRAERQARLGGEEARKRLEQANRRTGAEWEEIKRFGSELYQAVDLIWEEAVEILDNSAGWGTGHAFDELLPHYYALTNKYPVSSLRRWIGKLMTLVDGEKKKKAKELSDYIEFLDTGFFWDWRDNSTFYFMLSDEHPGSANNDYEAATKTANQMEKLKSLISELVLWSH